MATTETLADEQQQLPVEGIPLEQKKEKLGAEPEQVSEEKEEATTAGEEDDDDELSEEKVRKRGSKEEEEGGEGSTVKRRKRKGLSSSGEPVTPIQRPSRERKSVQRYSAPSSEKSSSAKGFTIQKGNGTPLKDIPNVAFKLSKRKADETLQALHTLFFGKRGKSHFLKRNILQFSGFVWVENQEKQKAKVRERLDKFVKEKLVDFCDVLDIPISKATTKKDDIVVRLLEFLESPHATTDVSLADREQARKGKKRRKKTAASAGTASRDASSKKRKLISEGKKKKDNPSHVTDEAEDDEFESADTRLHSDEDEGAGTMHKKEKDQEDGGSSSEEDRAEAMKESKASSGKKSKNGSEVKVNAEIGSPAKLDKNSDSEQSPPKTVKSPAKSLKSPEKNAKNPSNIVSKKRSATEHKVSVSKTKSKETGVEGQRGNEKKSKKNQNASSKNEKTSKKQVDKKVKLSGKGEGSKKSAVAEPSRDEMHTAVSGILKEVDFNTATLSDILKKLESSFKLNLMHRKTEVKSIIEEVINSMTDEEDDGEGDDGSEEGDGNADH